MNISKGNKAKSRNVERARLSSFLCRDNSSCLSVSSPPHSPQPAWGDAMVHNWLFIQGRIVLFVTHLFILAENRTERSPLREPWNLGIELVMNSVGCSTFSDFLLSEPYLISIHCMISVQGYICLVTQATKCLHDNSRAKWSPYHNRISGRQFTCQSVLALIHHLIFFNYRFVLYKNEWCLIPSWRHSFQRHAHVGFHELCSYAL